ncbi:MAG: SDR family oxidoreductase, partial [Leptospira sp.]|nr:SDR family oxidoreductase [Leptospira sp.]
MTIDHSSKINLIIMRKGDRETVIVPGGSGGIGREIVRELSEKNYNVINFDLITPEKLFKNEKFSSVNLRKENEIIAAFEEVKSENKNLYSLVYSAGWGGPFHSILDVKSTEWNMIMDVNLKGAFLCIREILPTLVQNKKG